MVFVSLEGRTENPHDAKRAYSWRVRKFGCWMSVRLTLESRTDLPLWIVWSAAFGSYYYRSMRKAISAPPKQRIAQARWVGIGVNRPDEGRTASHGTDDAKTVPSAEADDALNGIDREVCTPMSKRARIRSDQSSRCQSRPTVLVGNFNCRETSF